MEQNESRSISYYMRALHRDIGFFLVGLVIVYSLSGIVLVYRDIGFLTADVQTEKKLPPGVSPADLGPLLRLKQFKPLKTEGDIVYFREGTYNKATGLAVYTTKRLPALLQKWVDLHKTTSGNATHWCAVPFGALLCFLAVSSFWMCKRGGNAFRRGLALASVGMAATAVALLL